MSILGGNLRIDTPTMDAFEAVLTNRVSSMLFRTRRKEHNKTLDVLHVENALVGMFYNRQARHSLSTLPIAPFGTLGAVCG